jgi:hypothetical protein
MSYSAISNPPARSSLASTSLAGSATPHTLSSAATCEEDEQHTAHANTLLDISSRCVFSYVRHSSSSSDQHTVTQVLVQC